jgi:hypothetical protein
VQSRTTKRAALDRRSIALAVAIGLGIGFGIYQLRASGFDGDAYWNAALRLRSGEPLYIGGAAYDPLTYRYPAWFAWTWVPLSYLPHDVIMAVWRLAMVGLALAIIPALWDSWLGRAGLWLFVPMLVATGWMGNVQPAVVALTVYGGVGIAAGIKGYPLVALLPDVLTRNWRRVAMQAGIAAALWATILLFDVSAYPNVRGFWPTDLAVLLAFVPRLRSDSLPTRWHPRQYRQRCASHRCSGSS